MSDASDNIAPDNAEGDAKPSPSFDVSEYSETEQQIFDAALAEFARKGKDGARMQSIADAAGINKAMLHYYFRGKDQLYADVFRHTMQRFMDSFGASLTEAPTFAKTLRAFIEGYVSFVRDNELCVRLIVSENLAGGTLVAENVRRMKTTEGAPPRVMVDRIRAAVEDGDIRPVDPDHTILSIVSTCIFFFAMRPTVEVLHEDAGNWDAFVTSRTEHIFELIYRGLAPR
ncbi:TetR/AcrR family transcriptional regulator [Longibacter sp.]|uniref:TetR/AcrR family transcriptional regulator n=1 Tax=Longibacter sp. TaxID=2045415 RepID=UPI003EB8566F